MKIKIRLDNKEAMDIIKEYVLDELPIDTNNKDVYVSESYGSYSVEIEDKVVDAKEPGK